MLIYACKCKIVHFRSKSIGRTYFIFKVGDEIIETIIKYTYLGLVLDENLDFDVTARTVAHSAGLALCLVTSKSKMLVCLKTFIPNYRILGMG